MVSDFLKPVVGAGDEIVTMVMTRRQAQYLAGSIRLWTPRQDLDFLDRAAGEIDLRELADEITDTLFPGKPSTTVQGGGVS